MGELLRRCLEEENHTVTCSVDAVPARRTVTIRRRTFECGRASVERERVSVDCEATTCSRGRLSGTLGTRTLAR
jgi:hypothetical protein